MQVEDQASRAIYVRLRHRAKVLRGLAIGFVALIPLALAFGAIPYFLAGDMALNEARAALEMRRLEAEHAKGVEKRDKAAGEPAAGPDAERADPPAAAAESAGAKPVAAGAPAPTAAGTAVMRALPAGDETFAAAAIRVTAVVLLVALTVLFGSLYRYSMRLASYYDEKADALRLLEAGERQMESRLAQITVPLAPRSESRAERAREARTG